MHHTAIRVVPNFLAGTMAGTMVNSDRPQTEMESVMSSLQLEIAALIERVNMIDDRLTPVLGPQYKGMMSVETVGIDPRQIHNPTPPAPVRAPLVEQVANIYARLSETNARLLNLHDRLAV